VFFYRSGFQVLLLADGSELDASKSLSLKVYAKEVLLKDYTESQTGGH